MPGTALASLPLVSSPAPEPGRPTQHVEIEGTDATRRTRLANERTYLAWWRTGLAAIAVGVGAAKVVPALGHHEVQWPYTVAGAGFTALGVVCIVFGLVRQREVEHALARGDFAPPDDWMVLTLTLFGAAFGLLLLVVVLVTA
jgi:putative membrane protein